MKALKLRHADTQEWVLLEELTFHDGTRIDAFAFNCFRSKGFKRVAYEIKVSRSDFKNELKDANKRKSAMMFSDEFYFVAPKGMLHKYDIPEGCGLMEVNEAGDTHIAVRVPKKKEPAKFGPAFVASAVRNASGWKLQREFHLKWAHHNILKALHGFPKEVFRTI